MLCMVMSSHSVIAMSNPTPTSNGKDVLTEECPICTRAMRASKEMAKHDGIKASQAFEKYCKLGSSLELAEEKFCYDMENMKATLHRLLDLSASEERICRKVKETNPHFCRKGETGIRREVALDGMTRKKEKGRGVIYE
jgi:hypothetical protein